MPSADRRLRRAVMALTAALAVGVGCFAGCGPTVPKGGVPKTPKPAARSATATEAIDLIPADLDLVIRVDLSKVRDSLGAEASDELMGRAFDSGLPGPDAASDELVRAALGRAEVVWLAVRLADFEAGDRVLAVRAPRQRAKAGAPRRSLEPDAAHWTSSSTNVSSIRRFVAKVPPARHGTGRVFTIGERSAVFVSPVEEHSVERLLRSGPDAGRGQPQARGLVSLHYRASRLSPELENRFPNLSALVAGISQVSAIVDVTGQRLELDGRIQCRSATAALKVQRFLETIRDASQQRPDVAGKLSELQLSRTASSLHVRWPLPRDVVLSLFRHDQDS